VDGGRIWRVSELTDREHLRLRLRTDGVGLAPVRTVEPQGDTEAGADFAVPGVLVIDGPVLPGAIGDGRPLLAGIGRPWAGPLLVSAGADLTMSSPRAELSDPAGVGRLIAPLSAGPLGRWDEASQLVVEMPGDQFSSLSELAVLAGGVPLLVQHAQGWELIAYRDAQLIGADQYRLSGLLRGLQGSIISAAETGAVCVVLDPRLGRGNILTNELGLELQWQAEGRGLLGAVQSETFGNLAGLAFSSVHLRASEQLDGSVLLTWVHRGADITDSWILPESANVGRFQVQLKRGDEIAFERDTDLPQMQLETGWQSDDVVYVREYGADGRLGQFASLVL